MKQRVLQAAYWALPSLMAVALYWPGLLAWFQKDDFVWLGLHDMVHSWRDLVWALFAPLAQGTIRTLSERVFFMTFTSLFGLHALPYRLFVFVTGFVTLVVLCAVCTKLTRSRAAGFWAAIFWIGNSTNAYVFSWTAIYYELLCVLFLLSALWLLIRYAETGERRFFWAQWAVYLTGFLVLELNVVYPALALMYALCCARGVIRKTLPLFVPAAAYTVLHLMTAPMQASGPYRMFWDSSIPGTFGNYVKAAMGPNRLIYAGIHPSKLRSALTVALILGLIGFLAWSISRRQWLTLFFASWFVIVLAPLLPLRDHFTEYYLTVPTVGLAMWGGHALVTSWWRGPMARTMAGLLAAIYLCVNIPVAHIASHAFYDNSQRIRGLVYGVVDATAAHQERTIVLTGLHDPGFFFDFLWPRPFRLFHRDKVYLISDETPLILKATDPAAVPDFFITAEQARSAVRQNAATVLDLTNDRIRDASAEMK